MSLPAVHAPDTTRPINSLVDQDTYPLGNLGDCRMEALIRAKRRSFREDGFFNLEGFLRPEAVARTVSEIAPLMACAAYHHANTHNIYFTDDDPPLPVGHGARARLTTSNHTLTCDQLAGTVIRHVYEWDALRQFLAVVLEKQALYLMADPLARLNVMGYGPGDGIGWHFDRAEFTVTLMLQAAAAGGVFEYRRNLRTCDDPNYRGVARLLAGQDAEVKSLTVSPGDLNVFAGFRSPHRVTRVSGEHMRLIAILSFMERSDVTFSPVDRLRFYGRSGERPTPVSATEPS